QRPARRRCAAFPWPGRIPRRADRSAGSGPALTSRSWAPQWVIRYVAVSGKSGAQLTPGVEQRLVDRVAVGAELDDQGIQGNSVEHDRDENLTLPCSQLGVHGAVQRGEQIPPLGLLRGVETEPVRQLIPVLGAKGDAGIAPEMPPDLGRDLEDDELV